MLLNMEIWVMKYQHKIFLKFPPSSQLGNWDRKQLILNKGAKEVGIYNSTAALRQKGQNWDDLVQKQANKVKYLSHLNYFIYSFVFPKMS